MSPQRPAPRRAARSGALAVLVALALGTPAAIVPAGARASPAARLVGSPAPAAALMAVRVPTAGSGTATPHGSRATTAVTDPNAPVPVADSSVPPAHHRLSARRVLAIAAALPKMRRERARHPGSYGGAYLKGQTRWQVSYFSRPDKEIGQVLIDDATGRVLEQWTGFQVAWSMARGYPGAFGNHVNALYIWLPLSILFVVPFLNWRRPFSLLHLDLLVLSLFSVSLAFFNHGRIYASVPLAYPPLLYLLVRMLIAARVGRARGRAVAAGPSADDPPHRGLEPLRLLVPRPWLAVAVVFLIGFRVALNVVDSNVIDVGYAGVIGAHRIVHGQSLYGGWPADNQRGDTYGPVNYVAYVPFERLLGWSGRWDDLPAAHLASVVFDLLAVALLYLLGRRVRGPTLGVALAYAWVAYPFTLFALESNSNDALVAVLVIAALLAASPRGRGVLCALAGLAKFAPLALAPLLATHGLGGVGRRRQVRALGAFAIAFVAAVALVALPALAHSTPRTFFERTLAYQSDRGSPFSMWGLYGSLAPVQVAVQAGAVLLALAVAVLPRRPDLIGLAAASAAVLIGVQLGIDHWFYLYIPWFFPLVMLALLGRYGDPDATPAAASAPARSRQLVAA